MRDIVQDGEIDSILDTIQPRQVASYLTARGWIEQRRFDGKAILWRCKTPAGRIFEVLQPLDRSLLDFSLRMSQVLYNLSLAEQRPESTILRDIETALVDVIRVRVVGARATDGSIPIDDGLLLLCSARAAVLAIALSVVEPRAFHAHDPKGFEQATAFLKGVKLGQTERGGFVATIISPLTTPTTPAAPGPSRPSHTIPFGRHVTRTLMRALQAIQDVAARSGHVQDHVYRAAMLRDGVSANLCEALVAMDKAAGGTGIEVSMAWSSTLPTPDVPSVIHLPASHMSVVEDLGRQLKIASQEKDKAPS